MSVTVVTTTHTLSRPQCPCRPIGRPTKNEATCAFCPRRRPSQSNRQRRVVATPLLLLMFLFLGVPGTSSASNELATYTEKKGHWDSLDIVDYEYQYRFVPAAPSEGQQDGGIAADFMYVRVRDGAVTWAEYADGTIVPSGIATSIPTIGRLFDLIRDILTTAEEEEKEEEGASSSSCADVTVRYDRNMSYPRAIRYSTDDAACSSNNNGGGGYSIKVKNLKADVDVDATVPDLNPTNPNLEKLGLNRALWDESRAESCGYSFVYRYGRRRFVPVRVRNGRVVEVGGMIGKRLPLTVPELFGLIRTAMDDAAVLSVGVTYSSKLGYPTRIKIKYTTGKRPVRIYVKRMRIADNNDNDKTDGSPDMVGPDPNAPPSRELISAILQDWLGRDIVDYDFRYERRCESGMPPEDCAPKCVAVRRGSVVAASFAADAIGPPSSDGWGCSASVSGNGVGDVPEDMAEQLPTVLDLFYILIGGGNKVLAAAFDAELPYPTSGHVKMSHSTVPFVFEVTDMSPVVGSKR